VIAFSKCRAQVAARLLAVALAGTLAACASSQTDIASLSSSSDEIVWQAAEKAYQKKQWENARKYYRRIIDGFPQSEHLPGARLALAETYFNEGNSSSYILAVAQYREFLTLYPSHPKSDYAQFQSAEAYYRQKNKPDRDQTSTIKALEEYQRLLDVYPGSPHIEVARLRVANLRQHLARAEFNAGYFYQKTRKALRAAINRYEGLISEYPDYARMDEVLFRLAECLDAAGRKPEALPLLSQLMAEYPQSPFAKSAQQLTDAINKGGITAPPPAAPTTAPDPAEKPST
jgi:outer membrane protein assembly factor BamD